MPQKTFAIVTAAYNAGRYLPDFIASIENQDFDIGRVEVIAVDDGSCLAYSHESDTLRRSPGEQMSTLLEPSGAS